MTVGGETVKWFNIVSEVGFSSFKGALRSFGEDILQKLNKLTI